VQHGLVVIADQVDDRKAGNRCLGQQPLQYAGGVRAAIDVITDMQQQRCFDWPPRQIFGDDLVQIAQLHITSVDVADRVDASAFR
jgi:hypothetical protein